MRGPHQIQTARPSKTTAGQSRVKREGIAPCKATNKSKTIMMRGRLYSRLADTVEFVISARVDQKDNRVFTYEEAKRIVLVACSRFPRCSSQRRTITRFLALILRAYVHAIPPVTRRSLTVLVRIEGEIHVFLVECLSANRASIDVGWPLMSGFGCTPHAWRARHRG